MKKITVFGSFVMDMVVSVDEFPQLGETILAKDCHFYLGGKGANQCVGAARLGGCVEMIGCLGNDMEGKMFIELLDKEKIVHSNIQISTKNKTASAHIHINKNALNKIVVIPSANYDFSIKNVSDIENIIKNSSIVLLQLELRKEETFDIIRLCNKLKTPLILNPAPACDIPDDILAMIDYITPNEIELGLLTNHEINTIEDAIYGSKMLLSKNIKNVIVTLGDKGALIANETQIKLVPAYKVTAIDTVGAGDSFNGALALGITSGKTMEEIVLFANAVGALTVMKKGAIPSLPKLSEVQDFLNNGGKKDD